MLKISCCLIGLGNAVLALAQVDSQKVYQGFSTDQNQNYVHQNVPKILPDFEKEFNVAKTLQYSPGLFNSVRLSSSIQGRTLDTPNQAFQAAINTNTSILLGLTLYGLGPNAVGNEIKAIKSAISEHGNIFGDLVVGIVVGTEDLLGGTSPSLIVSYIQQVRAAIAGTVLQNVPVGHADFAVPWTNTTNPGLADLIAEVDFIGLDLFPWYETEVNNSIANAPYIFSTLYNMAMAVAGGKPIWIETGWPISGPASGNATASLGNAQAYWDTVGCALLGRTNIWWYTLDGDTAKGQPAFTISKDLTAETTFNLSCSAASNAPASINTDLIRDVHSSGTRLLTSMIYAGFCFLFWGMHLVP